MVKWSMTKAVVGSSGGGHSVRTGPRDGLLGISDGLESSVGLVRLF